MKYNGQEIKELNFDKTHVFDPPKELLVWDGGSDVARKTTVYAVIPDRDTNYRVITHTGAYGHCGEIPRKKLATYRELSRWLVEGKGQLRKCTSNFTVYTCLSFDLTQADKPVEEGYAVSKWDDSEWHSPTREYLGLED